VTGHLVLNDAHLQRHVHVVDGQEECPRELSPEEVALDLVVRRVACWSSKFLGDIHHSSLSQSFQLSVTCTLF
jgi:hypothetical protein